MIPAIAGVGVRSWLEVAAVVGKNVEARGEHYGRALTSSEISRLLDDVIHYVATYDETIDARHRLMSTCARLGIEVWFPGGRRVGIRAGDLVFHAGGAMT